MARKFWPNQDPIGQVVTVHAPAAPGEERPRQIVGVVGNVRQYAFAREPRPEMYIALPQQPQHGPGRLTETRLHKSLVLRTNVVSQSLMDSVSKVTAKLAPDSPVFGVRMVHEVVDNSTTGARFYMQLLAGFGTVALLLAAIGIYGVTSYSVSERSHEIGLRMALGAQSIQVLGLVLKQGLILSGVGVGIGLAASFGSTPPNFQFPLWRKASRSLDAHLGIGILDRRDHAGDVHSCAPSDEGRSHGDAAARVIAFF
jgi:putative ABC transport system permease protein